MEFLKRHSFQYISLAVLAPLAFLGARTTVSEIATTMPELPALNIQGQQVHALELSSKDNNLSQKDPRREILHAVKVSIPKQFQHRAYEIARAVINEANHHQMDPFFLLAMIKTESHFNIKARGRHGEIGLMQIMPQTANWLAAQAGLSAEHLNIEDPRTNIRLGATYVAMLRKQFKGYTARYIGAYNMGAGNVRKLMALNTDPTVYPGKVLENYRNFYKTVLAGESGRAPASAKTVRAAKIKKLQTRVVVDKCGTYKCHLQPIMPGWAAS